MPELNIHNDHVASCLCCIHLYGDYEADYSDMTPGEGLSINCGKGKFFRLCPNDLTDDEIVPTFHTLMQGATCEDFE